MYLKIFIKFNVIHNLTNRHSDNLPCLMNLQK